MFLDDDPAGKGPVPLSVPLGILNSRLGMARPDSVAVLESHWTQLLGSRLASQCHLVGLRDAHLKVEVDDPAVAETMRWMSGDLIAAANDICGAAVVEHITFSVRRRR